MTATIPALLQQPSVAAASLFTASDSDNDAITTYDFYDATGNGHFVVNGVAQAAGTIITVTAAQLAQTTYQVGGAADQLYVRASDGMLSSGWRSAVRRVGEERGAGGEASDGGGRRR